MRSRRVLLAVLGLVMIAGCGAGPAAGIRAPGGTGGTRAQAARPAVSAGHGGACSGPTRLAAGVDVAAWRLGAVRFASPRDGVALTAPEIPCVRSLGTMGTEVTSRAQPVRLAVTEDGGRHWITRGSVLPGVADRAGDEQVAPVYGPDSRIFGVVGGELLVTRDYGATWAGWLAVLSGRAAVVGIAAPHPVLASTADGGALWSVRPTPAGPQRMCRQDSPGLFAAAGPDDWWLLCNGAAAAGSSTKALMRSVNAGRTWTVAAAVISLSIPARAGSLPYQDGAAIAAGTPRLLWIATPNTLSLSTDGGTSWSRAGVNPGGYLGQFDVLPGAAAWLLAPGAGLWQTTDGITWHAIGGAGPLPS